MKPESESESNAVATWALLQPQGQRRVFFPMGGSNVVDLFPKPEPHGWGFKDDPRPELSFVAQLSTRRLWGFLDMLGHAHMLRNCDIRGGHSSEHSSAPGAPKGVTNESNRATYELFLRASAAEHRVELSDAPKLHDFCAAHRIPVPLWVDDFDFAAKPFDTTSLLEAQQAEREALTSRLALEAALCRLGLPAPSAPMSRL